MVTYAEIRPTEAALAAAQVRLCRRCEDEHFLPYPENPNRDCLIVECQCWCTTRRNA